MAFEFRLKLRQKILLACYFLAFVLLAGFYIINHLSVTQAANRGRFLEKHLNRFLNYEARLGDNLAVVLKTVVQSSRSALLRSLAPPAGGAGGTGAAGPSFRDTIQRRLVQPIDQNMSPDFLAVISAGGDVLARGPGTKLTAAEIRSMRFFNDILQGTEVGRFAVGDLHRSNGDVLVHRGRVYQAAGMPIHDDKGKVVAAIAVGVHIQRFFADYMTQSDNRPAKQHRLAFVRNKRVLASVMPQNEWGQLAINLARAGTTAPSRWSFDGWSLDHADNTWDFDRSPMTGYAGSMHGKVGELFILRTRKHKKAELSDLLQENKFFIAVGGILTLIVGWFLSWLITRPIERFIGATEDIAHGKGDLTRRITFRGRDEFAHLGENINRIFSNLHGLTSNVQGASLQMGQSSAQIVSANRQMLDGAKDQAVRIENSSAAVTELSTSIQQVAENAMETTRRAEQSGTAVSGAIERMNTISSTVDETAAKIKALGESIKRIGNIVEVIRQISEQTSLLALNASIEAAHAGEQGRGFAVVADEVSSLARRVGQSAKDIEDLIATITDQTSDAVQSMEVGTHVVEEGTSLVNTTLDDLRMIIEVIQDTARSVQEQAVVSDDIARNMDAVREIARRTVDSSEDAVVQGEQLFQLASRLDSSVSGFSVSGDGAEQPPALLAAPEDDERR